MRFGTQNSSEHVKVLYIPRIYSSVFINQQQNRPIGQKQTPIILYQKSSKMFRL
jgi:hypothetical protein